jgi:hypothetical protein
MTIADALNNADSKECNHSIIFVVDVILWCTPMKDSEGML